MSIYNQYFGDASQEQSLVLFYCVFDSFWSSANICKQFGHSDSVPERSFRKK